MSNTSYHHQCTMLKVKVNAGASSTTVKRRFQARLEPNNILSGTELVEKLAQYGFNGREIHAQIAINTIESFIIDELREGKRLDFGLVSFYPRLSKGLTARDADPPADGCTVNGAVKARRKLGNALKNHVIAVNPNAGRKQCIWNAFDAETEKFDEISVGHTISVTGRDIEIKPERADECVWLEKRDGRRGYKPVKMVKAEILESSLIQVTIRFNEVPPPGKYLLTFYSRGGATLDYNVNRIAHPIKVTKSKGDL